MSAPSAPLLAAWQASVLSPTVTVSVAWDGVTFVDETSRVLKVGGVYSVNPDTRTPAAATATVVLDNQDLRFSPHNFDGPLYPFLQKGGWPVRIDVGYGGTTQRMGTFWSATLSPSERDGTASLRIQDRWGVLSAVKVSAVGDYGVKTEDAFRTACTAAGLVEGKDYTVETGTGTIVAMVMAQVSLTDTLAKIAQAEGGRVYVDDDGIIRFLNRTTVKGLNVPLWTVTRSTQAYDIAYRRRDPKAANRVVLTAAQRTVQVEAVVASGKCFAMAMEVASDGLVYPGGMEGASTVVVEGVDPTTNEVGKVELTTVASISCALFTGWNRTTWQPTTGAAGTMVNTLPPVSESPSNKVYYTWTAEGTRGTLRLWSVSTSLLVVSFSVNGKPYQQFAPMLVAADDVAAQAEAGLVVPLEMQNDFLTTNASAVAKDLLLGRTGRISSADLPLVDGMPWARPGDVFDLYDDSLDPVEVYRVQILSHDWSIDPSGTFLSTLTTAPVDTRAVDPAPYVQTFVVAPSGTPSASSPDQGPWSWGPAGHPAIADASDWG